MTPPVAVDVDPALLGQDPANANRGTARGRYMVERSIELHGAGRGIVVDRNGRAIAGNKTLEAAVDAGLRLIMVDTTGDALVVTRRVDMDLDDPATGARSLAYADNRAGEVGLDWDARQVAADVAAGLDLGAWFFEDELAGLVDLKDPDAEGAEGQADAEGAGESPNAVFQVALTFAADQAVPFWDAVQTLADATDTDPRAGLSRLVLAALYYLTADAAQALDRRDVLAVIRSGRFPGEGREE